MNLQEQVLSLELSKELKRLGIEHESYFSWSNIDTPYPRLISSQMELERSGDFLVNAYTASELIELLPIHVLSKNMPPLNSYRLAISKSFIVTDPINLKCANITIVNYKPDTFDPMNIDYTSLDKNIWDTNTSNALGKMLIFLIENDLMGMRDEN